MKLKTLIGIKSEVGTELQGYADGYDVILLETMQQLQAYIEQQAKVVLSEMLLVASTDETIAHGRQYGIATMAYVNPSIPNQSYTGVDMIVEGMEEVDGNFLEKVYQRYHHIPWTVAETDRCILRELSLQDMDALYELYAQGTDRFTEPLYERKEEEEFQSAYIENMYRFYGYGLWLIFSKESGELIGRAGIEHREYNGEIEPELGYLIGAKYRRQGYATEVCLRVMEIAKSMTDFPRINCLIDAENEASIALAESLGFTFLEDSELEGRQMKRYIYILQFV